MHPDWKDSGWHHSLGVQWVRVVGPFTFTGTLTDESNYVALVYWRKPDGIYRSHLRTNKVNYTSVGSFKVGAAMFLKNYPRCTKIRDWEKVGEGG